MSLNTVENPSAHGRPSPTVEDGTGLAHLVAELTLEEKVALLVGADMWSTTPIERIGLRSVVVSDGPAGVRGVGDDPGATSASFPAPSALGATWDLDLAARTGRLFASEARRHGVDVVLAPQINLQRTPVGGRHFECYSEDPHLTAEIATVLVREAQAQGVGMCVKHFVANDSETERTSYVARVDERTMREVYLAPFERIVKDAGAWSIMGAYSGVDDGAVSAPVLEHRPLLTGVLKDEWGFDGVVVSDWLATTSVVGAVDGGLDLQMPGPDGPWGDGLLEAVRSGDVAESDLDDKVLRMLLLARRVGALHPTDGPPPAPRSLAPEEEASPEAAAVLLRELAARSVVVLKDDDGLVPLATAAAAADGAGPLMIALLGEAATEPFRQGGGSSYVSPDRVTTPADALRAQLPSDVDLVVLDGARSRLNPPVLDLARASDPVSGDAGVRIELLDADDQVLAARSDPEWPGWLQDAPAGGSTLRISARVRLDEPGLHELGVGTVGRHAITVDGELVSSSEHEVGAEVILDSSHNHPVASTVEILVREPRTVDLVATLQVVHPVGYESFVRGELVHRTPGPSAADELADAVALARGADIVVVMVGTTEEVESEGFDRTSLDLPGNQDELVRRVLDVNPRTVVVVNAGAPVVLPWLDDAGTVLWAWLAGQECGTALADVLLGRTEPSGRLPWTLPASAQDVPVPHAVPQDGVVGYTERLDIGYRGWQRAGRSPAACFGHGLGWSTWTYDDVTVRDSAPERDGVVVDVVISNVGQRGSREVVQVYVEPPERSTDAGRPVRWLGGFAVADVPAGRSESVRVRLPLRAFQTWDVGTHAWVVPDGPHRLRVGRSVDDLRLEVVAPL